MIHGIHQFIWIKLSTKQPKQDFPKISLQPGTEYFLVRMTN